MCFSLWSQPKHQCLKKRSQLLKQEKAFQTQEYALALASTSENRALFAFEAACL